MKIQCLQTFVHKALNYCTTSRTCTGFTYQTGRDSTRHLLPRLRETMLGEIKLKNSKRLNRLGPNQLSLSCKLLIFNLFTFATEFRRPWIFQTKNSVTSNYLLLKF